MKLLILGKGKTGSLVAQVAGERGHLVEAFGSAQNDKAAALTPEHLERFDVIIDFTTPTAAVQNCEACLRCGKDMVVGTTGWYDHLAGLREQVIRNKTGLVFGANFSIGINLFFDVAREAAAALKHGYTGQIFERHHVQKKDAPSGTALMLQNTIKDAVSKELEIISFREGQVVGMHEIVLDSPNDDIYLCHDSKSRRGFAEGAVRAAEWLRGRKGFFDFRDIWREV